MKHSSKVELVDCPLTQSFRFDSNIACAANTILFYKVSAKRAEGFRCMFGVSFESNHVLHEKKKQTNRKTLLSQTQDIELLEKETLEVWLLVNPSRQIKIYQ